MSGLEKMKFVAYQKVDYKEKVKRHSKFEVQINPDNFARCLSIDQPENKERGKKNSNGQNKSYRSETYTFKLVFDGTGIVPMRKFESDADKTEGRTLNDDLNDFLQVVYSNPATANPNFLIMTYCGQEFMCVLKSLNIQYTLFRPDGIPLRMTLDCSFSSVKKEEEEDKPKPNPKPKPKPIPPDKEEEPPVDCCVCPPPGYKLVQEDTTYASFSSSTEDMDSLLSSSNY